MIKIAEWEIKVSDSFKGKVTLYENEKHIIAIQDGNIVAIIRAVNNSSPRIEATNIGIFINENERVITLTPKMSLDQVVSSEEN